MNAEDDKVLMWCNECYSLKFHVFGYNSSKGVTEWICLAHSTRETIDRALKLAEGKGRMR